MTPHRITLLTGLALYLALAFHQLGLPGLHYDEAREAGLNAMEILTGAPITAFRSVGVEVMGRTFPLMVQDYIGALNVYLALPFLAFTGIGVPNLRALPVLCGLLALLLVERSVSEWMAWRSRTTVDGRPSPAPISFAGLLAVWLIAASPGFVFWSRQGVFVTNVTQVFVFLCIWQTIRWLRTGRPAALVIAALAAGLALYAKLLAIWAIAPLALFALLAWLRRRRAGDRPLALAPSTLGLAALAFAAPLTPLIWFNLQSGGTLSSIVANLGRSYYGVDNLALGANLVTRLGQLVQILRGDQFWYLGAVFANPVAPWVGLLIVALGLLRAPQQVAPPLSLLLSAVALSVFTVSDLFITHYALLQPLALGVIAVAAGALFAQEPPAKVNLLTRLRFLRPLVAGLLLTLFIVDLANTVAYHRALAQSGGLADHSDASYHLAYHLRYNGMGAPVALDWGIDATVRFLSEGAVTPIEIFGYTSPAAPDDEFERRLAVFLDNPDNVYLLHSEQATVFQGRRERFFAAVAARGRTPVLERRFTQRDGAALYEIWKAP
ncbi:glycosyltransferase family 39 protein [Caldilinea sp.]|uniref:glycosyltransferase family 39 protein n=1 Tax=Caldilinea sp. TaxID=2293560 RepID=UPI0021DBF4EF|nr:glycosyltransferase family 39 protein [Caldilinea sp.]GIV71283.1 MAG: hypothetical protein KatS3mg048_4145 [Caldilinea sp.]